MIQLNVPEGDPFIVIESQISNKKNYWAVKLSYSQPYFDQGTIKHPSRADVTITENTGKIVELAYDSFGVYRSKTVEHCVIGNSYTLRVELDGKVYTASEKCKYQDTFQLLMAFELPDGNLFIEPGWYVFEKAGEVEAPGDYYQWKIYQNDTLRDGFGYILDTDEFRESSFFNLNIDPDDPLKGQSQGILPRPFPFKFEPGDTIVVEQYSISKEYYEFLVELEIQQGRSGTPFDSPPANPNTNIKGGGYGFFSVVNNEDGMVVLD